MTTFLMKPVMRTLTFTVINKVQPKQGLKCSNAVLWMAANFNLVKRFVRIVELQSNFALMYRDAKKVFSMTHVV